MLSPLIRLLLERAFGYRELYGAIDWDFIHMRQHFDAIARAGVDYKGTDVDVVRFVTPSESRPNLVHHQWIQMAELREILDDPTYNIQDKVRLAMAGDLKVHCTCLTGDTQVPLLDGRTRTLDELLQEYGTHRKFWLYSTDEDGNFVPARARCLGQTGTPDRLLKVTLDNGQSFTCTPEHKIRRRDGSYTRADQVRPGDSLMPLYRRVNAKGYEQTKRNKGRGWWLTYWRTAEIANRLHLRRTWKRIKEAGESKIACHHEDENKANNDPRNLKWRGFREHWMWHAKRIAKRRQKSIDNWKDPSKRAELTENNRRAARISNARHPERMRKMHVAALDWIESHKDELSARMKETWRKNRAAMLAAVRRTAADPRVRELRSNVQKESWANPEKRQKRCAAMRKAYSDPSVRARQRQAQRQAWSDPELLRRHCETMRQAWKRRKAKAASNNHKVVKIEVLRPKKPIPVYDLYVEKTHNFLLDAGVIVHNCEAFLYFGYQFITTTLDAAVWPENRPPNIRNPMRRGTVCKHLGVVLKVFPFWWNTIAGDLRNQGFDQQRSTVSQAPGRMVRPSALAAPPEQPGQPARQSGELPIKTDDSVGGVPSEPAESLVSFGDLVELLL